MLKKILCAILCFYLYSTTTMAFHVSHDSNCILLGSKPSLMIKFRNFSSKQHPRLQQGMLNHLFSTKATFTSARPMAYGDYLVFFKPKKALQEVSVKPGCYSKSTLDALADELKSSREVVYAEPNSLEDIMTAKESLIAPIVSPVQWNLKSPPGGIDAETAYITTTGSSNAIIAVLDTGVLANSSLAPNLLTGATFNNGSAYNGATPSCGVECSAYDHGTHVSGIVAASGVLTYGEQIYGVAPTSKVLPINVFTKYTNPIDCGGGPTPCLRTLVSDQVNAMAWLNGETFAGLPTAPYVTTVNMSLGGVSACPANEQSVINLLLLKNIGFAISSGNGNPEGTPADAATFSPANCAGVMVVSATGPSGYGAFYSNYGSIVSYAAPGGDSTYGATAEIYSTIQDGYGYKQGTSMAAPHAAGLGALLYSIDPTLTPSTLLSLLQSSATAFPPGTPAGQCASVGYLCGAGIINANQAVIATIAQRPTLTWTSPNPTANPTTTSVEISWSAASWIPARSTSIIYTVNFNGSDVSQCTNISSTTCTIMNLQPTTSYSVYVKATDIRQIQSPVSSNTLNFSTDPFTGPVITTVTRNQSNHSQAYVNYSSLSDPPGNSYSVSGIPGGATVTLDAANNRFIVSNILTAAEITNAYITATYGAQTANSNTFTIPSIAVSPLTITIAARNPLRTTQAFIYYSSLPDYPGISYSITGTPAGATIQFDAAYSRFVVSNLTTPKKIDNVQVIASTGIDTITSNYFTIPNIM